MEQLPELRLEPRLEVPAGGPDGEQGSVGQPAAARRGSAPSRLGPERRSRNEWSPRTARKGRLARSRRRHGGLRAERSSPATKGDRRRRAQLEKAADAGRKARQAVGAGTADCGWSTATRRPCGSGDAERNLKRPRVRENLARRSTPDWQDAGALQAPGRQWGTASTAMGRSKPIRSGPGQLPGRVQDAARTPYLGSGCAQDGIGGAAEARAGGDGVRPSRGTENRALTNREHWRGWQGDGAQERRRCTRTWARLPRLAGPGGRLNT